MAGLRHASGCRLSTTRCPKARLCRAAQAAEAITAMQRLVSRAIAQGHDSMDPDALAEQITRVGRIVPKGGAGRWPGRARRGCVRVCVTSMNVSHPSRILPIGIRIYREWS